MCNPKTNNFILQHLQRICTYLRTGVSKHPFSILCITPDLGFSISHKVWQISYNQPSFLVSDIESNGKSPTVSNSPKVTKIPIEILTKGDWLRGLRAARFSAPFQNLRFLEIWGFSIGKRQGCKKEPCEWIRNAGRCIASRPRLQLDYSISEYKIVVIFPNRSSRNPNRHLYFCRKKQYNVEGREVRPWKRWFITL